MSLEDRNNETRVKNLTPSKMETLIVDVIFSTYPIIWFFLFWPLTFTLKLFPDVSNYWFANFYSILMNANKDGYDPFKSKFFETLMNGQITSCDQKLRSENKFRLLEIGVGPGTNFKFYPKNTSLIAVDNNLYFKKYFDENLKEVVEGPKRKFSSDENSNIKAENDHLTLEKFLTCSAENLDSLEDNSVDIVVATHLLCSVQSPEKVLSEIHRVLTPRGKYYMLEHVAHRGRINYFLQWLIKPFWSIFNGCCDLQRDTLNVINCCKLFEGTEDIEYGLLKPLPFPVNPNISGILTNCE